MNAVPENSRWFPLSLSLYIYISYYIYIYLLRIPTSHQGSCIQSVGFNRAPTPVATTSLKNLRKGSRGAGQAYGSGGFARPKPESTF